MRPAPYRGLPLFFERLLEVYHLATTYPCPHLITEYLSNCTALNRNDPFPNLAARQSQRLQNRPLANHRRQLSSVDANNVDLASPSSKTTPSPPSQSPVPLPTISVQPEPPTQSPVPPPNISVHPTATDCDVSTPTPAPDTNLSSSDESDNEPLPTRYPTVMPGQKATIVHLNIARAPTMLDGVITPDAVCEFEQCANHFFLNAKGGVTEEQKVTRLLGCFKNSLVRDWMAVEETKLVAMTFKEFMKAFRKRWLPKNWESDMRALILDTGLDPTSESFEKWAARVQSMNVTLRGTPSHFSEAQLRTQLEAGIDKDLRTLAMEERANDLTELLPWLEKLNDIDQKRRNDRKRRMNELEDYMRKRPITQARNRATAGQTSTSDPAKENLSNRENPYPPKLTQEERHLLQEHDGCFKCRKPYAGHRSGDCTVTLSGKDYKPLTAQDALRIKALKTRNTPVAVITDPALGDDMTISNNLVAALFPESLVISDNSNVSEDSLGSVRQPPTLKCKHLLWRCRLNGPIDSIPVTALIDSGAHVVLIRPTLVEQLGLKPKPLPEPEHISTALSTTQNPLAITHYVELSPKSLDNNFCSEPLHAIIADGLCAPIILGLPFLVMNRIHCNYAKMECIATVNNQNVNLLASTKRPCSSKQRDILAAIHERARNPAPEHTMLELETELRKRFSSVFEPLPHVDELPDQPVARIRLKDPDHSIKTRNYPCPRKWKDAWHTLLQQHLEAGRIRPSDAPAGCGAFIIPKADPTVLPRWVNDYRQLNANTITDSFPLPRISEILADCGSAKFFGSLDMTNSFFQTRMHPDDVKLTAVNTPWGLYEWVVMPMGIKNAPAIHQRRVTSALRPWIGSICHVYLDDIVIWSNSIEDHTRNVTTILNALKENKLYCNPKKTKLFGTEIQFLGHRISENGIEVDEEKTDRIQNWPVPISVKQVRGFLGLARYLASFLPKLADYTSVLDELTRKECEKDFPEWTPRHQAAFDNIKRLATSTECLTTIDLATMPTNKIFITTDASDYGSGAILTFGPSYGEARPVGYDSRSFKGAELNYPVHEKEMLAIVRALAKWRTDLLGHSFEVWTDHRTLEHFSSQRDLSRRQARWMEFLSQYDATIRYLPGEQNTAADSLSRFPGSNTTTVAAIIANTQHRQVHSRFQIEDALLEEIRNGYQDDPYTEKLTNAAAGMSNIRSENGYWFVDDRLFVPKVKQVREILFRLAHDKLGHFGGTKSYTALRDSFYWPRMKHDLEQAYIPSCPDCQRNKSRTTKPVGPLHPLPVPDQRCDSVAMDFIGPLPTDEGYDCILTFTDRLGSDIRIIPTTCTLTAQNLAKIFFDEWYCENGLPLEIISDRDKLFVSHFWKALHELTGVKLKMSSSYHPETDGASERTNKTVIQCIRFAVERDQKGWARMLPKVRFDIMNTINKSTGYTPFQLRFGKSPRILPPITKTSADQSPVENIAKAQIELMLPIELDAQDNLITAKITQAHTENHHRQNVFPFRTGERVVLSTAHRRHEYKSGQSKRVAKFMPRYDGPYTILSTNEKHSTVTLDLPHAKNAFPVFHTSEISPFKENDDTLFPERALRPPEPILIDGEEEYFIDKIVDERRRGKVVQYRVRWQGEGPEGDK